MSAEPGRSDGSGRPLLGCRAVVVTCSTRAATGVYPDRGGVGHAHGHRGSPCCDGIRDSCAAWYCQGQRSGPEALGQDERGGPVRRGNRCVDDESEVFLGDGIGRELRRRRTHLDVGCNQVEIHLHCRGSRGQPERGNDLRV